MYGHSLEDIVGKKVLRIFMNEDSLKLVTGDKTFTFTVKGECCSHSYFYDFYGVKHLLNNGPVTEVKEVELGGMEPEYGDRTDCYGFQLTTEHPEFGPVTSVFSFRNDNNGYYGGWMYDAADCEVQPEIFDDVVDATKIGQQKA